MSTDSANVCRFVLRKHSTSQFHVTSTSFTPVSHFEKTTELILAASLRYWFSSAVTIAPVSSFSKNTANLLYDAPISVVKSIVPLPFGKLNRTGRLGLLPGMKNIKKVRSQTLPNNSFQQNNYTVAGYFNGKKPVFKWLFGENYP